MPNQSLEDRISYFEDLLDEIKTAGQDANATLKQIKRVQREVEQNLGSANLKEMVDKRVEEVVEKRLAEIGPEIQAQTTLIYKKVHAEVDKLIDLCLGKEFSVKQGREDLRPQLAEHLRKWVIDILNDPGGLHE